MSSGKKLHQKVHQGSGFAGVEPWRLQSNIAFVGLTAYRFNRLFTGSNL
jgi:hypothetical protein